MCRFTHGFEIMKTSLNFIATKAKFKKEPFTSKLLKANKENKERVKKKKQETAVIINVYGMRLYHVDLLYHGYVHVDLLYQQLVHAHLELLSYEVHHPQEVYPVLSNPVI